MRSLHALRLVEMTIKNTLRRLNLRVISIDRVGGLEIACKSVTVFKTSDQTIL